MTQKPYSPGKRVTIVFDTLVDSETGMQRFVVRDNGGELEEETFDMLEDAIKDIDDRRDHYMILAKVIVPENNIRVE